MTLLKKSYSILSNLFWLGVWIFGLGVLFCFLGRSWPGDRLVLIRLMNYIMPWLLGILLFALLFALLAHHNWLALTLTAPIVLISLTYAPLFLPKMNAVRAESESIKIMSYNIWRDNENMTAVAEVILKERPDILLLQELTEMRVHLLLYALKGLYPDTDFNFSYEPKLLQAVISRYPITPLKALPYKGSTQNVKIQLPSNQITIFNVHPLRRWERRHQQITALLEEKISTMEGPVILGGDFNTTDQSQTCRLIGKYMNNTHWQAGFGFGFTFPADGYRLKGKIPLPPLVRIDHVFYSDHFSIREARTLKNSGGSDHYPVTAELFLLPSPLPLNQSITPM